MKRIEKLQNINELVKFLYDHMDCTKCPCREDCNDYGRNCSVLLTNYLNGIIKSEGELAFKKIGYKKSINDDDLYTKDKFHISINYDKSVSKYSDRLSPVGITPEEYECAMLVWKELYSN